MLVNWYDRQFEVVKADSYYFLLKEQGKIYIVLSGDLDLSYIEDILWESKISEAIIDATLIRAYDTINEQYWEQEKNKH